MKKLRSGYTTGACAAAAAKAAVLLLRTGERPTQVEIPFPDGRRVNFVLHAGGPGGPGQATATVIKDAGDDPDVTNGAEICATVWLSTTRQPGDEPITILGGHGVGKVTKPGLALPIGAPAINPVPQQMIRAAVTEALRESGSTDIELTVAISVPAGLLLAEKTLNARLGIIGGISILGTTGIVRPISAEAWTATISAAMDVAAAGGNEAIVLSTGRTSEAALEKSGRFKPEALIMMGDYLQFAFIEGGRRNFTAIHYAGMWAKIVKAALRIPQTHVRFGILEMAAAIELIGRTVPEIDCTFLQGSNTAREIYQRLMDHGAEQAVLGICRVARAYLEELSGLPVTVHLVHPSGTIVMAV